MPRFLFICLFALFFTIAARADYHYASHTGSNQYPYTSWETAADSIQKAINAATAGDTIYVGSGVWEDVPYILHDALSMIGRGIDSTTIRKGYYPAMIHFITAYGHNLVAGFKFDGEDTAYPRNGVQGYLHAQNITITDNWFANLRNCILLGDNSGVIENNTFSSVDKGIDASFEACDFQVAHNTFRRSHLPFFAYQGRWFITNNIFHHNPWTDMAGLIILGVIGPQDTAYVANNLFFHNLEEEVDINTDLLDVGSKGYFENNTFVGPPGDLRFVTLGVLADTLNQRDLTNNVISGFRWPLFNANGARHPIRLYYNDFWNYWSLTYGPGAIDTVAGNLFQDPMFMDSLDFHLQAFSPLIDAGDPNILDVDGTRSDIGCYGGPGGCSYVYLDLAPLIPDSLSAFVDSSGIHLTWRNNYEADFNRYQVFRDTISGFPPSVFNMIGEPVTSYFLDINISPGVSYYYRLTSVDNQRNVSDHSVELAVYQTGMAWDNDGNLRPEYASIEKAYPNPFNQDVTIVYSASNLGPQPPEIKLVIYDIQGRIVKTLVDERKPAGTYRVAWDGNNDLGEPVSSGNYITKLYQWGMGAGDFPVKITLVR